MPLWGVQRLRRLTLYRGVTNDFMKVRCCYVSILNNYKREIWTSDLCNFSEALLLGTFSNENGNAKGNGSEKSYFLILLCAFHRGFVFSALNLWAESDFKNVSPWSQTNTKNLSVVTSLQSWELQKRSFHVLILATTSSSMHSNVQLLCIIVLCLLRRRHCPCC